jgi:hypothetical protein
MGSLSVRDLLWLGNGKVGLGVERLTGVSPRKGLNMATPRTNPVPQIPAPTPEPAGEFTFEVGDFATGKHRATSKVPDTVADLLEDLRESHGREVTDAKGSKIAAGAVKFKTVTVPHKAAGDTFAKHVRSYSKTAMYPEWSARLSRLSDTTFRVGVGPVKPKPRRPKTDTPDSAS